MTDKPVILVAFREGVQERANLTAFAGQESMDHIISVFDSIPAYKVRPILNTSETALLEAIEKQKGQISIVHLTGSGFSQHDPSWISLLTKENNVKFVFLSGCATTELVHQLLESGVQSVIAIPEKTEDSLRQRFVESFYRALTHHRSLLNAFELGSAHVAVLDGSFEIPSAVFFNPDKKQTQPLPWGLYLYPENQDVLNWKLQTESEASILPPPPPILDPESVIPPRKKKGLFGGLKLNVIDNFFKVLTRRSSTSPILHELPSSRSEKSPRIISPSPGGGLEIHEEKPAGFLEKIALAKQKASPETVIQLDALAQKWNELKASFEQKTLVRDVVRKRPPHISLSPGRIEDLIERAIAAELFELRSQLLEKELEALSQPLSRGLILRKPILKNNVGKYYALVIGINTYEDPGINSLTEALEDATSLHKLLSEKYFFDHVKLLKNPNRDAIIDAFDELHGKIKVGDNVLIFYAGHGKWDKESEIGYWLPSDAHHDKRRNWIENSTIHNEIKRLKPCQHVLLISDSCFSGALLDTRGALGPAIKEDDKDIQILYKAKSRQILTSGAKEPVPDDSIFFNSLIKTLQDLPEDTFSTHSLFHQIRTEVLNDLRVGQNPQVGKILHAGDDGGDFVFFRK